MYFNREMITLKYFPSPYVYRVTPQKAFRTSVGTEVKVYVSNFHCITTQDYDFQYCKFGDYIV